MVVVRFVLVVSVFVVSSPCTTGVQSALTLVPDDSSDGNDDDNDEYKDNITGNLRMISGGPSVVPVPLKNCEC